MTIRQILTYGYDQLKYSSKSPQLDAEVLLAYAANKPKEYLLSHPDEIFTKNGIFTKLLNRRKKGEPIAYITGCKEFCNLNFTVTPDTLIPRPETEELVNIVINNLTPKIRDSMLIIDIGTGSGCIAITLAKKLPNARFVATDISKKALEIASQNARKHDTAKNITFLHGNLLNPILNNQIIEQYNNIIIVANLPYLTPDQIKDNPSLSYEPKTALLGGSGGIKYFKELNQQIYNLPSKPTAVFLEIDPFIRKQITKIFSRLGNASIYKDLRGEDRYAAIIMG